MVINNKKGMMINNRNVSYDDIMEQLDFWSYMKTTYDRLIDMGISRKKVHFFDFPLVFSGYSGETIVIRHGSEFIAQHETSNLGRKRAKLVFNFSKRSMKRYIRLREKLIPKFAMDVKPAEERRPRIMREIGYLLKESLVESESVIKPGYNWCVIYEQ